MMRKLSTLDQWISQAGHQMALTAGSAATVSFEPSPSPHNLSEAERKHSAGLMRVNHVGEVCAQALYAAQAMAASSEDLRDHFLKAGREEEKHLQWTAARLKELGARPSLLNPLWAAGAFGLGLLASAKDSTSLAFVVETEKQVEEHLAGHLETLPLADTRSRAMVAQMKADEAAHASEAQALGASQLPAPIKAAMRASAKLMTSTAYYI